MGCDAGQCILIVIPSLEGWPTKAKEAPPHEVRRAPLDTNPVFQNLGNKWYYPTLFL